MTSFLLYRAPAWCCTRRHGDRFRRLFSFRQRNEKLLGVEGGVASRRRLALPCFQLPRPHVRTVFLTDPCFHIISQIGIEDFVFHALAEKIVFEWEYYFYAVVEIAR